MNQLGRYASSARCLQIPRNLSDLYTTGSKGERLLTDYLRGQGRAVEASDTKTFDLVVDGMYAEVKSSKKSYAELGFIGLSQNQFAALEAGTEFSLFLVCNLDDPDQLEVIEIASSELRGEAPTVESTYYWYRSQLDRMHRVDDA